MGTWIAALEAINPLDVKLRAKQINRIAEQIEDLANRGRWKNIKIIVIPENTVDTKAGRFKFKQLIAHQFPNRAQIRDLRQQQVMESSRKLGSEV